MKIEIRKWKHLRYEDVRPAEIGGIGSDFKMEELVWMLSSF